MKIKKVVYLYHSDLIMGYQQRFPRQLKYPVIDMFDLDTEQRLHVLEADKVIYKDGRYEKQLEIAKD